MTDDVRATATPGRRPWRRLLLLRGGAALLLLAVVCLTTLICPQLFFAWARASAAIHVRSDEPIPESAARVIALAESRIRQSTLFEAQQTYPVHVCNARWRWNYFSGFNGRARGFQTPLGRAAFIRPARWDTNHLAGPDGRDGARSLDVYIAHELTHMMVADHIGLVAGWRLPVWLREGYAEYVARHDTFDYAATRAALIAGDAALGAQDQYWKYLLLVTHLIEREGQDVRSLLAAPPDPDEVAARIRAGG